MAKLAIAEVQEAIAAKTAAVEAQAQQLSVMMAALQELLPS